MQMGLAIPTSLIKSTHNALARIPGLQMGLAVSQKRKQDNTISMGAGYSACKVLHHRMLILHLCYPNCYGLVRSFCQPKISHRTCSAGSHFKECCVDVARVVLLTTTLSLQISRLPMCLKDNTEGCRTHSNLATPHDTVWHGHNMLPHDRVTSILQTPVSAKVDTNHLTQRSPCQYTT